MQNQVVAYSPNELVVAQSTVRSWCAENIRRLLSQKREADQNVSQALSGHFNSKPFKANVRRCERRIDYYKKIGKAIKLGYMIVPNFDLDLFAVRTKARKPRSEWSSCRWAGFPQEGQKLPEGEGRYVDDNPFIQTDELDDNKCSRYPVEFDEEITFPTNIIKPQIIKETQRAMGYKLFDQVGTAIGRRLGCGDPIICGRLIDPTRNEKAVTFFIAWWLDSKDI